MGAMLRVHFSLIKHRYQRPAHELHGACGAWLGLGGLHTQTCASSHKPLPKELSLTASATAALQIMQSVVPAVQGTPPLPRSPGMLWKMRTCNAVHGGGQALHAICPV